MGGKRTGSRKQIHLCLAILILLSLGGCAFNRKADTRVIATKMTTTGLSETKAAEANSHLVRGQKLLAQGDYRNALKENEKVLSLAGHSTPAEESLFYLGLIYAHPANPVKDYGKSLSFFRRLLKEYPQSPLVEQVKAIAGLLQENDKQNRTIERLNNIIEESKKVDLEIEQRKREKTK